MIVECGHCGAPLDIEHGRSVTTCAYCAKKNRVASLKTIAPVTPPDFRAPEVWRPPASAAADSNEALAYQPSSGGGGRVVAFGALVVVAVVVGLVVWSQLYRGSTVEDVAREPLERTPDQVEHDLHVTYRTDDTVRVTFRPGVAGPYEHVWYRWDAEDKSLPMSISLFALKEQRLEPRVIPSLTTSLHGGLDAEGSWTWGAVHISADPKSGMLTLGVGPTYGHRPNLLRKRQLTAGWQILRAAAFGGPAVPASELVSVLGGGYPTKGIGAIDPTMPFSLAQNVIPSTYPGALVEDASFEVALDHPLFYSLQFAWTNAGDGKLNGVHFRVAPAYRLRSSAWIACLTKEAGAPEETFADYAKGKKNWTFSVRGNNNLGSRVEAHADAESSFYLTSPGDRYDVAAWRRTFEVLDRCR